MDANRVAVELNPLKLNPLPSCPLVDCKKDLDSGAETV
jgi:hypothetical protein